MQFPLCSYLFSFARRSDICIPSSRPYSDSSDVSTRVGHLDSLRKLDIGLRLGLGLGFVSLTLK